MYAKDKIINVTKGFIMSSDNQILEMIVDVRPVKGHKSAWVISACVEDNGRIHERYIEPFDPEQIKCGSLGVFDGDKFEQQQDYYDTEYDIATVESKEPVHDCVMYNTYSPKCGFDIISSQRRDHNFLGRYDCDIASVGNNLLLDKHGNILANLTTRKNVRDLWNGCNLKKYNLRQFRNKAGKITKYNTATYPYECRGMPAVMLGHGIGRNTNAEFVFVPQYNKVLKCDILIQGVWQPMPRPSDIVLLNPTDFEEEFVLLQNLTLDVQNREIDKKFGRAEYDAKIRDMWQNALNTKEHE